jgi:hypothetical protein
MATRPDIVSNMSKAAMDFPTEGLGGAAKQTGTDYLKKTLGGVNNAIGTGLHGAGELLSHPIHTGKALYGDLQEVGHIGKRTLQSMNERMSPGAKVALGILGTMGIAGGAYTLSGDKKKKETA